MKFLAGPISPARAAFSKINLQEKAILGNEPMTGLRANLDKVSKMLSRPPENSAHRPPPASPPREVASESGPKMAAGGPRKPFVPIHLNSARSWQNIFRPMRDHRCSWGPEWILKKSPTSLWYALLGSGYAGLGWSHRRRPVGIIHASAHHASPRKTETEASARVCLRSACALER
jgi:hypothetical protein